MIVYGVLTPLENILREVLEFLGPKDAGGTIGLPWAWSIVALTVIVRTILLPLTVKQIHSMQNLQKHAPQMKEIQKKFKHDKQRQQEELMKFYRENKINPAASCLPLLAQLPVFLALYFVLNTFSKDPPPGNLEWLGLIHITEKASEGWGPLLLVIYATSQVASTYFMSTTMDKVQRGIMMVLPIAFIAFIINFKCGLVLYWVTTNLWTVGQGLITRRLVPRTPAPALEFPKRASRRPKAEPADGGARREEPKPAAAAAPAPAPKQPAAPRRVRKKKRQARPRR